MPKNTYFAYFPPALFFSWIAEWAMINCPRASADSFRVLEPALIVRTLPVNGLMKSLAECSFFFVVALVGSVFAPISNSPGMLQDVFQLRSWCTRVDEIRARVVWKWLNFLEAGCVV